MRRLFRSLCLLLLLLPLIGKAEFVLIYSSNTPEVFAGDEGELPGIARLGGYINQLKASSTTPVVFVSGGDSLAPNSLSAFDKGQHMIELFNLLEPSVFAVAKRELNYGLDELTRRAGEAEFPLVSSNLLDTRTGSAIDQIKTESLIEVGDTKVGFIVLTDPTVIEAYSTEYVKLIDSETALNGAVTRLQQNGAEYLVLLTDMDDNTLSSLLDHIHVDLVLIANEDNIHIDVESKVPRIYAGGDRSIARVVVTRSGKGFSTAASLRSLQGEIVGERLSALLEKYNDRLFSLMGVQIGVVGKAFNTKKSRVRTEENAFGNLVADALRNVSSADVVIVNGGSIRGNRHYLEGDILYRKDLLSELPFGDRIGLVSVSGDELWSMMENSVSMVEEVNGRFLQVSGMTVDYRLDRPVGQRVIAIQVAGEPLVGTKQYRIAASEFLLSGGDGYHQLTGKEVFRSQGLMEKEIWHLVSDYMLEQSEVSPQLDGRLHRLDNAQ